MSALTSCTSDGSDGRDPTISTAPVRGAGNAAAVETTTTLGRIGLETATLEFTACMRDGGIDIPDIRLDARGRPVLDEVIASVDTTTAEFRNALTRCADILTRAGALDLRTDPELQAVILDQLRDFTDCARREGLRAFPDPDPAFTGTGSPYPLDEVPFTDPLFEDALGTCQEHLGSLTIGG